MLILILYSFKIQHNMHKLYYNDNLHQLMNLILYTLFFYLLLHNFDLYMFIMLNTYHLFDFIGFFILI